MELHLNPNNLEDYRLFLKIKAMPQYRITGRVAWFPDEYASQLQIGVKAKTKAIGYEPLPGLYDYQAGVSSLSIRKHKFGVFMECGRGKTLVLAEFMRHARKVVQRNRKGLIISPLMVIEQTLAECEHFYGDKFKPDQIEARDLSRWLTSKGGGLGITNYDALDDDTPQGNLGWLGLDESSMLKSHYGKWGQTCIRLGKGLEWKIALTGTPAPNDRIEYANHAVFLDAFPTVNSFLSRFFVNRGQTNERWELKPHALEPFYRALSHWCIFLSNPATYGWKDKTDTIPPIHVHIHDVDLTTAQNDAARDLTGTLFSNNVGGIGQRSQLARIAKGGDSLKPAYIRKLIESWPDESTLVWCRFNEEQERLAAEMPWAGSLSGDTPMSERRRLIAEFKEGRLKTLISKPKILGFGLNLHVATRQVFSSLHDSYEEYYQAVKRSNRIGSIRPLNVHLPLTDVERPMADNVLRKAAMVQKDTEYQERLFREFGYAA